MIAEVFPNVYDHAGRAIFRPGKRHYFAANFPMGRHATQPLRVVCRDLHEVFLRTRWDGAPGSRLAGQQPWSHRPARPGSTVAGKLEVLRTCFRKYGLGVVW
jgi:hypothetical protein